eukprot:ctg_178.g141
MRDIDRSIDPARYSARPNQGHVRRRARPSADWGVERTRSGGESLITATAEAADARAGGHRGRRERRDPAVAGVSARAGIARGTVVGARLAVYAASAHGGAVARAAASGAARLCGGVVAPGRVTLCDTERGRAGAGQLAAGASTAWPDGDVSGARVFAGGGRAAGATAAGTVGRGPLAVPAADDPQRVRFERQARADDSHPAADVVRRAVFVDWDTAEDGENVLHVRHYAIRKRPVGLSRAVRRMVQRAGKRHGVLPLGQLEDVSQVLDAETMAGVITSESEAEPPADCQVDRWDATPADESIVRHGETAPPRSRSTPAKERQAIRLVELGPRLTLQLVKVEAGMCRGEVLYHASAHRNRPEGESSGKRAATGERYRAPKVPRRVTWQEEVRVADSPALDSSGDERSPAESDA